MEEETLREWLPMTEVVNQIPIKEQMGLFSKYVSITCVDVIPEYIAFGTNVGALFWYNRKLGQFEKFKCEANVEITCIKIASTVDYMVACGQENGQIGIFQIPKIFPDTLPDCLKPPCNRKLERYTVTEIHNASISALEWSTNGMKLFSGDRSGLVVLTELDFSMHICKEMAIVNESYEIVQLSYCNQYLLISSTYRSVVCHKSDDRWKVCQVGKKDRKSLGKYGGIFIKNGFKPTDIVTYCSRPGLRIWVADIEGAVQRTLLFKDLISSETPEVPLLNPISNNLKGDLKVDTESMFGRILYFSNKYLVTYESNIVFILDPENLLVVGVISRVRKVLSVACCNDEIFILEGERSLIRIAFNPEPPVLSIDTSAIPTATLFLPISNSIKDFTSKLQATSILTALPNLLEANSTITECCIETDVTSIVNAEEATESPLSEKSTDIGGNYVEKIVSNSQNIAQMVASLISNNRNDYISKFESPRHIQRPTDALGFVEASEECLRKLELYNKIGEENFDNDILYKHSRRKKKRQDPESRMSTSLHENNSQKNDIQPLNLSMINLPPDFTLKPDLRSPDSIQNDILTKEKLISDVVHYKRVSESEAEEDKEEKTDIEELGSETRIYNLMITHKEKSTTQPSSNNVKHVEKTDPQLDKPQMPVWVQASKPPSAGSIGFLQRIKKQSAKYRRQTSNNLEDIYKNSYDPDDYLGMPPVYGLPSRDLTDDSSDVSLTDWEIL